MSRGCKININIYIFRIYLLFSSIAQWVWNNYTLFDQQHKKHRDMQNQAFYLALGNTGGLGWWK